MVPSPGSVVRYPRVGIVGRGGRVFTRGMTDPERARAIDELSSRLQVRFPGTPAETLRELVSDAHRQYDGSRIRDFVPVLVEREVSDRLRVPRTRRPEPSTAGV